MKLIRDKVKALLEKYPHLRDNDYRLMANIWHSEARALGIETASAFGFLESFSQGKLTNPESIRRSRQQVQEKNPHLRGAKYAKRQDNTVNVQKDLGYGTN